MTRDDLMLLVGGGASSHVAFVDDFSQDKIDMIGKTVSAFLNGSGGYIFAGIMERDNRIVITGKSNIGQSSSGFEQILRSHIAPLTPVFFSKIEVDGSIIDYIAVPQGKLPPYAFDGDIYLRKGSGNIRAGMSDVRELVLRSEEHQDSWENRFAVPSIEECVELEEIRRAINDCERAERLTLAAKTSKAVMESLGLIRLDRLLNAGVLMFASHPGHWLPQIKAHLVVFRSDKADDFEDVHLLDGPLCDMIEKAEMFVKQNSRKPSSFSLSDGSRSGGYVYPPIAVREALVNAFAHREYASALGSVSVFLYPDRLEIWNSGSLPEGVTVEGLNALRGQPSILQNPIVSNALYLRGYMERTGRGSTVIPEECKKFGLPDPIWEYVPNVGVKFVIKNLISASGHNAGTNMLTLKRSILGIITENPGISRRNIILIVGKPQRTVQRAIDELILEGMVVSKGKTRSQGYHRI